MLLFRCCEKSKRRHSGESFDDSSSTSIGSTSEGDESDCERSVSMTTEESEEVVERHVEVAEEDLIPVPEQQQDREWDSMFFPQLARACCCAGTGDVDTELIDASPVRVKRDARLTASFRIEAEHMPAPARPQGAAAASELIIDNHRLPNASLESLRKAVLEDNILQDYLNDFSKATDIDVTNFTDAPGGFRVRRAKFIMPVPQDVPAAIARLAAVPKESKATVIFGFHSPSPDELLILLQQVTHDVPYGENFRVNETLSVRPLPEGGVTISKWTSIRWIQDLPWFAGAIKPITESKTKAGSLPGGHAFLKILCDTADNLNKAADAKAAKKPSRKNVALASPPKGTNVKEVSI